MNCLKGHGMTNIHKNDFLKVSAVGDIALIGQIADNMETFGMMHPFLSVKDRLLSSDVVFGNLEMPFSGGVQNMPESHQSKHFFHSEFVATCLKKVGFSILSLANNHIMECGESGLKKTIEVLDSLEIENIGAGKNLQEARQAKVLNAGDLKIGFLAYSTKSQDSAEENTPGPAPIVLENILEDINLLKKKSDFIIVSLHLGLMYMNVPSPEDIELCHSIIDNGCDVILGHHPHVLQGIEDYNNGVIFYSLGEFVFDRKAGVRFVELGSEERRESIIANLFMKKDCPIQYEIIPAYLNDDYQVEVLEGELGEKIIDRMNGLSEKISLKNDFYKEAGSKLVSYELGGLIHHFKKGNFRYVFSKLKNLRLKHFRLLAGFVKRKIAG